MTSPFFGTSLAATLTSMRVDTVVVAGFSRSGCMRASATDALQHGFAQIVVRGVLEQLRTTGATDGPGFEPFEDFLDHIGLPETRAMEQRFAS